MLKQQTESDAVRSDRYYNEKFATSSIERGVKKNEKKMRPFSSAFLCTWERIRLSDVERA